MRTGWPPGLLQDDDRKLSKWFATRPGSRYQLRKNTMNQEIIRMAKSCGINFHQAGWPELERFFHMAQETEREACAKVCEDIDSEYEGEDVLATWCAAAIRARGWV